jgi:hypothetical protein
MKDKPVPWPPSFAPPAFDARRYEWSLWQLEILKHLHFIQARVHQVFAIRSLLDLSPIIPIFPSKAFA